jgi:hypothetical protein
VHGTSHIQQPRRAKAYLGQLRPDAFVHQLVFHRISGPSDAGPKCPPVFLRPDDRDAPAELGSVEHQR